MALKSTITAPPVIEGVTQVNSDGDTIIATPVVLIDKNGEFASLSGGGGSSAGLTDTQLRATPVPVSLTTLPTGTNIIGAITNSSFGISGTLPSFTTTPTFNVGTISTIATENTLSTINIKLPSNLTVSSTRLLVDGSGVNQPIFGNAYISKPLVTRPANTIAYTSNDVYGGVIEFPNIGSSGGNIILTSIDIIFQFTTVPSGMGSFLLFLYDVTPLSAIADNGAFSIPIGDRLSLLTPKGISLGSAVLPVAGAGTVVVEVTNLSLQFKLATGSTSLFGYLVTTGAFTPASNSEVFVPRLRSIQV